MIKALIRDPANHKLVSVARCRESAIKVALQKLDLGELATTFLSRGAGDPCADLRDILRHLPVRPPVPNEERRPDVWFASHPSARRKAAA